ncbi:hypothetical protein G7Y89_g12557 [Cudoniella acicularis]|uniref:Nephrocystin 3-like N-terminal domain-containing protein n=1 Tax=Cudoniella acicularis TaxID=354080 RepID=A0A8H4R8K5_9HELO|nr:hypothetical protein G7Y89_g12557 [Cudoniella acicularis]
MSSATERLRISILNSKVGKFEGKLREVRNASELVDKELQTHATYGGAFAAITPGCQFGRSCILINQLGLDSLGNITSDVHSLMDKIDRTLERVQHLSDYTLQQQLDNELLVLTHENTRSVLSELKSLPLSITHEILDQMQGTLDLTRMKQWLVLSATETSPPVPHADDTCSWLLQHPSFLKWTQSEETPVLWVQGHGGCGKSVMAGYLQEHLTAEGSNTLFYRFQRSASTTQSTPTSFASSLISQLLERSAGLPSVTGAYHQLKNLATQCHLGPQQCAIKTIWAVAASLLKMCGSQFIFIIDAMDECSFDGPSLPGRSAFLNTLFESIRETRSKVVIFTRPEPMFVTAMQSGLSIFMAGDLLLPDVMTFARREYEQLGLPDSEMDRVLELVHSSSHGSFRWTELLLHDLGQSLNIADLRTRIRTLPPSIGELYRQSLLSGVHRFSTDELECRNALLLTIFQAQRPLRTTEIAHAFSLRPERAEIVISGLCKPLASTFGGFFHFSHPSVREFFELCHQTGDDSLGISFSGSHGLLAEKSLSCLLEERYADLHRIESYLIANYDENAHIYTDAQPREGSFYNYAFRFWDYHLVRTKAPSKHLLRQANNFILSLQFAYWSERSRQDYGELVRVNVVFGTLVSWHKGLSSENQALLGLDNYFERAYSLLGTAFDCAKMDKVLPWLTRMTIGDFYFIRVLPDKATSTHQQVLAGLQGLLGPRHHLTLCAKSGVAYVKLYAGKIRVSNRMYNEVVNIQREVLGERSSHFLETLLYKGQSEYYMADFAAAITTWTKVSAEHLGLLGPESWQYLGTQWWYSQGVAYMGHLDLALQIFQSIVQKRHELFGPGDSFANVTQSSVGEIQLILGQHEESIATIQDVLVWRREVYPPSSVFRLDIEIALAIAYYAAGMKQAAQAMVEEIEEGADNLHSLFERYCQVAHLKGLLLAEEGFIDMAIHLLQNIVTEAEEDQNNRALLWIRLDLATLLKRRDAEGDRDQASANFDNIVKDISGDYDSGIPDEPDPPRLLAVAEKSLRLVRARRHHEARQELNLEQVDWRRSSDFWLWVGGTFYKDFFQITPLDLT